MKAIYSALASNKIKSNHFDDEIADSLLSEGVSNFKKFELREARDGYIASQIKEFLIDCVNRETTIFNAHGHKWQTMVIKNSLGNFYLPDPFFCVRESMTHYMVNFAGLEREFGESKYDFVKKLGINVDFNIMPKNKLLSCLKFDLDGNLVIRK